MTICRQWLYFAECELGTTIIAKHIPIGKCWKRTQVTTTVPQNAERQVSFKVTCSLAKMKGLELFAERTEIHTEVRQK